MLGKYEKCYGASIFIMLLMVTDDPFGELFAALKQSGPN